MLFPEEALDPVLDGFQLLNGGGLTHNHNPRFGYGRPVSYVPLLALSDGLATFALLRSLCTAAVAPLVYAAARVLGATRSGALAGGAIVAVSPDLLQTVASGHEAYLSAELAAVAVLGFALMAAGDVGPGSEAGAGSGEAGRSGAGGGAGRGLRPWAGAALFGAAFPLAAMNHPFATGLILLPVFAMAAPAPFPTRARSAAWFVRAAAPSTVALGLAIGLLLPHLRVLERVGFSELARPEGGEAMGAAAIPGLFGSSPALGAVVLLAAPLAALAAAWLQPDAGRALARGAGDDGAGDASGSAGASARTVILVAAAALTGVVAVAWAGTTATDVNPWYWRPVIPLGAVCLALAARGWVATTVVALAAALAVAQAVDRLVDPAEELPWTVLRADVVDLVAEHVDAAGPGWAVAGYGVPAGQRRPELMPLAVDAVLAGRRDRWAGDVNAMGGSPTIVQVEGPGYVGRTPPPGLTVVGAGPEGITLAVEDDADARMAGKWLCRGRTDTVRYDDLRDFLGVLHDGRTVAEGRPPGVSGCVTTQD